MVTIQMHNLAGMFLSKPREFTTTNPDGSERKFWSCVLTFVNDSGERQEISLYSDKPDALLMQEYDSRKVYALCEKQLGDLADLPDVF